jgi:hypothetical protein
VREPPLSVLVSRIGSSDFEGSERLQTEAVLPPGCVSGHPSSISQLGWPQSTKFAISTARKGPHDPAGELRARQSAGGREKGIPGAGGPSAVTAGSDMIRRVPSVVSCRAFSLLKHRVLSDRPSGCVATLWSALLIAAVACQPSFAEDSSRRRNSGGQEAPISLWAKLRHRFQDLWGTDAPKTKVPPSSGLPGKASSRSRPPQGSAGGNAGDEDHRSGTDGSFLRKWFRSWTGRSKTHEPPGPGSPIRQAQYSNEPPGPQRPTVANRLTDRLRRLWTRQSWPSGAAEAPEVGPSAKLLDFEPTRDSGRTRVMVPPNPQRESKDPSTQRGTGDAPRRCSAVPPVRVGPPLPSDGP